MKNYPNDIENKFKTVAAAVNNWMDENDQLGKNYEINEFNNKNNSNDEISLNESVVINIVSENVNQIDNQYGLVFNVTSQNDMTVLNQEESYINNETKNNHETFHEELHFEDQSVNKNKQKQQRKILKKKSKRNYGFKCTECN